MADDDAPSPQLESREPTLEDLRDLCRALNERGAAYVVIGGFAMRAAGYNRRTMDVDLLVSTETENESRLFDALATLPDKAIQELGPGEIDKYTVVRVADEIVVDLMKAAGGIDYAAASAYVDLHHVGDVLIPFANAHLLWRMKSVTGRAKDAADLAFLRHLFTSRGEEPPAR